MRFYVGDTLYTTFEIGEENINFYFAEVCANDNGVDVENIIVYFYTRANF